jgi:hypothetical protein
MRITSAGNVGIGTTTIFNKLHIDSVSGDGIYLSSFQTTTGAINTGSSLYFGFHDGVNARDSASIRALKENGTSGNHASYLSFATRETGVSVTERMRITSGGAVLVGTQSSGNTISGRGLITANGSSTTMYELQVGGAEKGYVYHSGADIYLNNSVTGRLYCIANSNGVYLSSGATSWTANSDERLKNINGNIENAVGKLMSLRAVNFSWKNDENQKENLGLIAQDVQKVFPQVIDINKLPSKPNQEQEDETDYLGVRYQDLIPVLIKAIQELKTEIDSLKNQIK